MSLRTVAIAVDPSGYSEKAFDCEYEQYDQSVSLLQLQIRRLRLVPIDRFLASC